MSVSRISKAAFINFGLLFIFLASWVSWYIYPVAKSFFVEENLFYGKVSYAAIPSLFGGSDLPFFDKTFFQINGDTECTFVLYASDEILDRMAEWFDFSAMNASEVPLEIYASRVGNKFVVKSMASTNGELSWDELSIEYQFYWCFIGLCIVGLMFVGGLTFVLVGVFRKPRAPKPVE